MSIFNIKEKYSRCQVPCPVPCTCHEINKQMSRMTVVTHRHAFDSEPAMRHYCHAHYTVNTTCAFSRQNQFTLHTKTSNNDLVRMASMAAMEQATLGQYFTTRRKGLEGVHPAKRRKVDVTEIESDVTVRRSQRSKRQVASSPTKISRSRKGAKSNAKGSLNEDSVQSSCKSSKVVSETTSLFDDHAFAEALIGKLTDAQRKRKMASSAQMEEAVPRDKSDVKISQAQGKKDEIMESKPSRRRTARSSKSAKQAEKSENSKILQAAEQVISRTVQTPQEADIPVEKETASSPCKTPPVVRRIGGGGVKANPWIAEQAKIVLSRGRAAVNLSQKSRNKEEKQITASKDSSSGEIKYTM